MGPVGACWGTGGADADRPNGGARGLATTIFSALASGALYALTAVLLTIPLVRCGIINFAQMFYVVLGGYVVVDLLDNGWSTPRHRRRARRPRRRRSVRARRSSRSERPVDAHESTLVTAVGVGIAIEGFIIVRWGTDPRSFEFFAWIRDDPHLRRRPAPGRRLAHRRWRSCSRLGLQLAVKRTLVGHDRPGRDARRHRRGSSRGVNIPRLRTAAFALAGRRHASSAWSSAPRPASRSTPRSASSCSRSRLPPSAASAASPGAALGGFLVGFVEAFGARYLNVDWVPILIFHCSGRRARGPARRPVRRPGT